MRLLLVLMVMLTACAGKNTKPAQSAKDTTQVIELALKTVLGQHFPEMDAVRKTSYFKDSIFFTTTLFPLSHLPAAADSFRFKILPDTLVCSVLKSDTVSPELPNYLRLQTFEKTDTGYFVQFESVVCIPSPTPDASVGLHIVKTKDRFVFKAHEAK